jgi:hypothetical protein
VYRLRGAHSAGSTSRQELAEHPVVMLDGYLSPQSGNCDMNLWTNLSVMDQIRL